MATQVLGYVDGDTSLERQRIANIALAGLIAIGLGQLADLVTFVHMISAGGLATEANPVVHQLAGSVGLSTLLLIKLALIPFLALVFVVLARMRSTWLAAAVVTLATLAGLFGALTNVMTVA